MAGSSTTPLSLISVVFLVLLVLDTTNAQGLKLGFYKHTCLAAESIVKKTTENYISRAPTLAASLLRMHVHDCFVRGCDGSVLLNATSTNKKPERSAISNLTLRGFQVIDAAKAELEKVCPGVVSCSDILALAARDAIVKVKGPFWPVPTGRRDGRISLASEVSVHVPEPFANISSLKQSFIGKGLTVKDLAVLSGGHTIGIAHCPTFSNRLYNFTGKGDTDPSLDKNYIPKLKSKCKPADTTTVRRTLLDGDNPGIGGDMSEKNRGVPVAATIVEMNPGSFKTFDGDYYSLVAKRRGLFQSDAALLDDAETKAYVKLQAVTHGSTFFKDFSVSMMKLGKIEVLTGKNGEIRKRCAFVN